MSTSVVKTENLYVVYTTSMIIIGWNNKKEFICLVIG